MDKSIFRNPPSIYRAAPFWSWNGELTPEETRWQVREMAAKGMGGGFMHARFGLVTEYLGEDWFASCAASIDEGKRVGFFSWLYDEDCWPSGSCSGRTAAAHPDFRARLLAFQRGDGPLLPRGVRPQPGEMTPLAVFRITELPGKEPTFELASLDDAGKPGMMAFYSTTQEPQGPGKETYADLLHDGAMREFLRNTFEVYEAHFRKDFGKAVPGVFTDEPQLRGPLAWSVRMVAEFELRRGYDLLKQLPHLVMDTASGTKLRHDYWLTVTELFDESFMKQIGDWCAQRKLSFTGHLNAEQSLASQIANVGGCMPHYLHMGAPGIDILRESIEEVITCKQTSSVANQFGKERVLSELYGCTGYNFTFEGQKWIGDWQMALGVNLLCPHLTHYSMKGRAKRDYPPSYSYQTPWWRHYKYVADYQARLTYALMQGRPVRDVLLLHPLTGAWSRLNPLAPQYGLGEMDAQFKTAMQLLLDLHRDFDLGDEMLMARHGKVKGAELVVAKAGYKVVIVPPTPNLESSTLDLLEAFVEAGGKLLFMYELPTLLDGAASDRAQKLAQAEGVTRISPELRHLEEALDAALPRSVSVINRETGREAAGALLMERRKGEETILFVASTNREQSLPLSIRLAGKGGWQQWVCETGEVKPVASSQVGNLSEVEVTLAPVGSAVLVRRPGRPAAAIKTPQRTGERDLTPRAGWNFHRVAPNSLILDRCTWRVDDEPFSSPTFTLAAQGEWRKKLGIGWYTGSSNSAFQPWKMRLDPENLKTISFVTLRYPFIVDCVPRNEVYLVLEDRAVTEIQVNGARVDAPAAGWFMDKSFEKVPVGGFLKRGENVVEVRIPINNLCTVEEMYLIGDFGVDATTFAITEEPGKLTTGDWSRQGYPFYTDAMIYETRVTLAQKPKKRVDIELPRFDGTVAAIWVNGEKAAVIGWKPYSAEVTKFLKAGINEIGIEIVGSPRNLMGPRHTAIRYPAWTGPGQLSEMREPTYHITPAGLKDGVKMVNYT
jgi:hypothetical protein